jgi:hypothetical protein
MGAPGARHSLHPPSYEGHDLEKLGRGSRRESVFARIVVMPRFMRGIQYSAASRLLAQPSLEYWIARSKPGDDREQ